MTTHGIAPHAGRPAVRASWIGLAWLVAASAVAQDVQAWLKVARLASSRGEQITRESVFGPAVRDYSRCVGISIQIRGMGRVSAAILEWYFFAKELRGDRLWIFDLGEQDIVLDPAKPLTIEKVSKELSSTVTEYFGQGHREVTGNRIEGYLVRILAGGKVVNVAASSKPLETLGRDQDRLSALKELSAKIRAELAERERHREGDHPRRRDAPAPPPREPPEGGLPPPNPEAGPRQL